MAPRVGLQVRELGERLGTARVSTFVRFIAGVGSYVLLEVRQLGELPLADLAPVRLDAQMYPGVLGQVARVGKGLCTLGALVRFGFAHMQLATVQLEFAFVGENLERERKKKSMFTGSNNLAGQISNY